MILPIILSGSTFQEDKPEYFIYVVSLSWHTGIIVPGYAFPENLWPDGHDMTRYDYLEIGWGDRDYFQSQEFNTWYAIKAAFWPTHSTLHFLPLPGENLVWNYDTKLVELAVSTEQLGNLSEYIISHLKLDNQGQAILLKKGWPYSQSRFFAGSDSYYFPKNSNVWAARALSEAGYKNTSLLYQTTGLVVNEADNYGRVID